MKLLNLKFKNINSLSGSWEIDFAKPEFTVNGIFAITGKTGAGKSSILDAITLALYGKTPRVNITGQNNDVMTRGASDCYAEIMFEIGGKKWKSAWKQERTRTGTLKPVNRLIADETNKILADKVSNCDSKIVEILGLTFQQFTKVIMLTQGSFAAFLQADSRDKGELLEQITGTDIYGEISRKVFERNKAEKEKLEKILIEIGANRILTEDEIETLHREIEEITTQKIQIDSDLQKLEAAKRWLADLENLHKQIAEARQKMPDLLQNVDFSRSEIEQRVISLKEIIAEKEHSDKIIVKVRELDTQIAEKRKALNLVLPAITELMKTKNHLAQTLEEQEKNLKETQDLLQKKQEWALINVHYEALTGEIAVIENHQNQVNSLLIEYKSQTNECEKAKKELQNRISDAKQILTLFAEKEKALCEKEQEFLTKKTELSTMLAGKELAAYQEEKENLLLLNGFIKTRIEVEKDLSVTQQNINRYHTFIVNADNSAKDFSQKITDNQTRAENLKSQIHLLDENIKLTKTIQSLDEHRKSLKDGKPCPLCGSTEHPFALGNEPKMGEKETELKNMKAKEQQLTNTIRQDEKSLMKLISDKENMQTNKEKAETLWLENSKKRETITSEISNLYPNFTIPPDDDPLIVLEKMQAEKQHAYKQVATLIAKATESEKTLRKIRDTDIPQLQQAKQTAEKAKTDAETNRKLSEQNVANFTIQVAEAGKKYTEKNAELHHLLEGYGAANIEILRKFLKDWNENKKAIEILKEQISKLERTQALTNSEMGNNQTLMEAKTQEKERIESEKQLIATARYELFGSKQAEVEEKRLKDLVDKAEKSKADAEKAKTNAITELAKNQAVITDKEKEFSEKQETKMTEKTAEELQTEYAEKKPQSDLLSQKIGANRHALVANEENLRKNRTKLDEKELQQQICIKWGSLNELIGSQDGKKYRNFAQALTFEFLIGLANRQLLNMSERYVLKRVGDAQNPFELSVKDKFQNCEERTVKNLSGGETFIISLSLALGLSNMASRNMNIDTMFIDEGFGSLDSDYLDVSLSALSNLQNEGKLIGVISHLSELKERIATHIAVIPKGDGHSRIEM